MTAQQEPIVRLAVVFNKFIHTVHASYIAVLCKKALHYLFICILIYKYIKTLTSR